MLKPGMLKPGMLKPGVTKPGMMKPRWTTWRRAARDTRGAEIAETAMILPLVFMMLMAIFWFGQAFRIYGTITHAAREGARAAVAPACATCPSALPNAAALNAQAAVNTALTAASLSTAQVQAPATAPVLYTCSQTSPCGSVATCSPSVTNMCVQTNVQLSSCFNTPVGESTCGTAVSFGYKYPYHFAIPYTKLDLGNITLPAQAEMRMENQ
jgi:Flp pilus assembly protein TadG